MKPKSPPPNLRNQAYQPNTAKLDPARPFPSDQLPQLKEYGVRFLGTPVPVLDPPMLLIDANRVLSTIWTKARYTSVETRTPLEEAVAAGVVQVFAPPELLREVDDEHLSRYQPSTKKPLPFQRVQEARRLLLSSIQIVEPPDVTSPAIERLRARDPKDVSYAQLFEHLKLDSVLSRDADWEVTGYHIVKADDHDLLATLKKYARTVTEEIGRFNVLTTGTFFMVEAVKGAWNFLGRAPPALRWLGRGAMLAVLANPGLYQAVLPKFVEFCEQLQENSRERAQAQQLIERDIKPNPRRLSITDHALRVLVKSSEPLKLPEITQRVRTAGAVSQNKDLGSYLRRQMKHDGRFVEHSDGRWSARDAASSEASPALRPHVLFTQGLLQSWRVKE
ncbi:HTH domain-containing protein [Myxococcus virescens]|uniref:HB1, ASXL, restriction endonuclease HTH domain n=1 Tax=Myxococcus virescens TaxID=83456 RepID=A0A511HPB5_9BACT|nr:HTH domain-containing protein [Myxococcus virescens]GEL75436.1 hypothetical protein MVI01_72200 [Myxococcus virescens]SDE88020.1 HB1, ASXL, restriction endonuclease HTH domain [Myxococcus virescens]